MSRATISILNVCFSDLMTWPSGSVRCGRGLRLARLRPDVADELPDLLIGQQFLERDHLRLRHTIRDVPDDALVILSPDSTDRRRAWEHALAPCRCRGTARSARCTTGRSDCRGAGTTRTTAKKEEGAKRQKGRRRMKEEGREAVLRSFSLSASFFYLSKANNSQPPTRQPPRRWALGALVAGNWEFIVFRRLLLRTRSGTSTARSASPGHRWPHRSRRNAASGGRIEHAVRDTALFRIVRSVGLLNWIWF